MPRTSPTRRGLTLTGWIIVVLALYALLWEPNRVRPADVSIPCENLSAPVRIILFSDVAFRGRGIRERAVLESAAAFAPDVVAIAGDFIEEREALEAPADLDEATRFLEDLPATRHRFLAPGEFESQALERLRKLWPDEDLQILENEARTLPLSQGRIDLFVADALRDPAPWALGRDHGRPFVATRGRHVTQHLLYQGEEDVVRDNVEITFAFQILDRKSHLELRLAWQLHGAAQRPTGWRLVRREGRPTIRLIGQFPNRPALSGRTDSGFDPPTGTWCRARVRLGADGGSTRLSARFWPEWAPEPPLWMIDAETPRDPERDRGTVGFASRSGRRRLADLRVVDGAGRTLLTERFDDPTRLERAWLWRSALRDWVRRERAGATRILLAHNPDIVRDVIDIGGDIPDLVLAGHTHGGQIRLPGLGALYTSTWIGPSFDRGLFDYEGLRLYITPGVGTSVLPFRLFSPPEVTRITLVPRAPER